MLKRGRIHSVIRTTQEEQLMVVPGTDQSDQDTTDGLPVVVRPGIIQSATDTADEEQTLTASKDLHTPRGWQKLTLCAV